MLLSRWRRWRRGRPFWGGLFAVLAGAWICVLPLAPLKIMLQQGVAGIPSVLMGIIMIVLGLTAWFSPGSAPSPGSSPRSSPPPRWSCRTSAGS